MKLRTVEMVGFKSFRQRETIEISDGITCIVGPNGCGKSNVVDAIKWAMGEMSPTSLRGDSLSDVIFAGTEQRKPAGMAEVTLTFDNTDEDGEPKSLVEEPEDDQLAEETDEDVDLGRSIPRQFRNLSEIAITRRLHQDGKSEYLINKVDCRLRDIRNLLAGTGLGKQGYSIIEQGEIGFIVNARPSERRLILEEASGITRYKDRRKRAARKLDRTRDNLDRTRDILQEIEGRMESLEQQAERAKEHKKLSSELESLQVGILVDRHAEALEESKSLADDLDEARREAGSAEEVLEEAEENLEEARERAEAADRHHANLKESYYELETQLNLKQSNRDHARDARQRAADRREELMEERERQKKRRAHFSKELDHAREKLEEVDDRPADVEEAIEKLESQLGELESRRADATDRRDELRETIEHHRSRIQRIDDRVDWIDEQVEDLKERRASIGEEIGEVDEQREDLERSISRLTVDHERVVEEIAEHQERFEEAEQRLEEAREAVEEAEEHEQQLARRKMSLETRVESLEQMRRRGEGYEEGVQRVLEWARDEGREDIFGAAGDFLQVPEGRESAYAAFAGDRLDDIVVRDRTAALAALRVLEDEEAGRVGCVPLPDGVDDPAEVVDQWVEDLEIVENLREVPEDPEAGDAEGWATPDGDVVFADGRIVGGGTGDRAESVLRQVRELENMQEELEEVGAAHDEAGETLEVRREEAGVVQERVEKLREQLQERTHRARQLEQDLEAERREKSRADERHERLVDQRETVEQNRDNLVAERTDRLEQREQLVEAIPPAEDELEEVTDRIELFNERIEEVDQELTDRKIEVAQIDERRNHLRENVERFEEELREALEQIDRIESEIDEQITKRDEARMRAEALDNEVERLRQNYNELEDDVDEAEADAQKLRDHVETLELKMLDHRQDVEDARETVQDLKMARRERELDVEHAVEQLQERFELDVDEARDRADQLELPSEQREDRARQLEERLDEIGEVNPLAIEEFEEAKQRHEFHAEQQQDLEESVADLRAAIERMDRESRRRFQETFEAVDEKFREVFPRLFRGGKARLKLTEPDDILESGVDIEVQPPGKKLQNVSLLSGGEKALTAVSLIFAIFMLKPSPFAILDEVDAPLDDANVGRFAEMVDELSEMSQMILITHNRRTMETPDRLYGVTMEEAGVSKIVSLELSEVDGRMAS